MSVVVLVTRPPEATALVHWGALFGRALGQDVVVAVAAHGKGEAGVRELDLGDESALQGAGKVAAEAIRRTLGLLPGLPRPADAEPHEPTFTLFALEGGELVSAVLGVCKAQEARLLLVGRRQKGDPESPNAILCRTLFERAPCETILLRPGDDPAETAERILVPTAGEPHATVALGLAAELAAASGGRVTALYVQTELGLDAEALGARVLNRAIGKVPAAARERIDPQVVLAEGVLGGIAGEAEGYDLVLMGTSSQWFIRRILFKTLPEAVLGGPEGTSVAVVRKAIPLRTRLEVATKQLLASTVPQLAREDRVALVERLQASSRWSFDFVFLTCLSTLIAALGLIANNVAVVIGAMLVAPLMTPLIGVGLGLVQGNLVFLRATHRTVTAGFLLALGIGCLVGWIARPELTAEMASRGSPGLLDLVVAYASGMAAAYAIGRPGLSAALPGVAIAASLVPPIATAGLALVAGELHLAAGSALLFFTNMVAIALGSATSLFAAGIRSEHLHRRQNQWARRAWIALFVLAAGASILLAFWLARRAG